MKNDIQADFNKSFPSLKTIYCDNFKIHENKWVLLLKNNNEFVMICYFFIFQPIMSPSVLDKIIRQEKKIPPEYSTAENCVEMQVGT